MALVEPVRSRRKLVVMWLLGSVVFAIVVVLSLLCLATPDAVEAGPARRPITHPSVPKRHGVPVQVLFASPSDDAVLLDCIACADARIDGAPVLHPGTPFTVRAQRNCTAAWADAMIDNVLSRWADSCAPVEMLVINGPAGREVRIFDDTTRVQLPIAA